MKASFLENFSEWLVKLTIVVMAVLAPIRPLMISISVLVAADFLTGVWAAFKRGEPITSNKFRRTISKGIVYQLAILVAFVLETYLMGNEIPIIKVVASLIGLTETKSFFENVKTITGLDVMASLLDKFQGKKE